MIKPYSKPANVFIAIIAITAWLALALQLYIMIETRLINIRNLVGTIVNFFSYFTILTNILVALASSFLLIRSSSALGSFFSKSSTLAAITLYIFIVGLTYNTVLRSAWSPAGVQKWVDEALHVIVPVLFIIFWIVAAPKGTLNWIHPLRWLIYPAAYLTYALLRGALTGFYTYFFINADELGYSRVLLNAGGLMLVFIITGFIIVGVDKLMSGSKSRALS